MELYRKVRLACRDGMSERAAARHFGVSRQSVRKMLQFSVPPGYRRTAPVRRPKLDEFTALIEQWLEDDRRHGYVDRVVIGCAAEVIARHPRSYEGEDMVFDPIHYLPLIERKTGALDQAAPLAGWELPDSAPSTRPWTPPRRRAGPFCVFPARAGMNRCRSAWKRRSRRVPRAGGGTCCGTREAPKSVGSNGETVFRLKGEGAFEVDVWTFNRRCRLL